jgi:hypothetical protein
MQKPEEKQQMTKVRPKMAIVNVAPPMTMITEGKKAWK